MKNSFTTSALASLYLLAGCRSESPKTPPPVQANVAQATTPEASGPTVFDFSPYDGKRMTLEEFLKACHEVSGINFTYSSATKDALSASYVSKLLVGGTKRIVSGDFEGFLGRMLAPSGFEAEHIGPEHLRVLLIKRRAS